MNPELVEGPVLGPEAPESKIPQSAFDGIDMSPKRQPNELYCDYKCRLWWVKRLVKFYLKGKPIWQAHMGPRYGSFTAEG